jgi:hypothetical protein
MSVSCRQRYPLLLYGAPLLSGDRQDEADTASPGREPGNTRRASVGGHLSHGVRMRCASALV